MKPGGMCRCWGRLVYDCDCGWCFRRERSCAKQSRSRHWAGFAEGWKRWKDRGDLPSPLLLIFLFPSCWLHRRGLERECHCHCRGRQCYSA